MLKEGQNIFENSMDDLLENILIDFKKNNPEIRNRENYLIQLSHEMATTVSRLDHQQKNAIEEYLEVKNSLEYECYKAIYIQSFKDCVKFLQFIELL